MVSRMLNVGRFFEVIPQVWEEHGVQIDNVWEKNQKNSIQPCVVQCGLSHQSAHLGRVSCSVDWSLPDGRSTCHLHVARLTGRVHVSMSSMAATQWHTSADAPSNVVLRADYLYWWRWWHVAIATIPSSSSSNCWLYQHSSTATHINNQSITLGQLTTVVVNVIIIIIVIILSPPAALEETTRMRS